MGSSLSHQPDEWEARYSDEVKRIAKKLVRETLVTVYIEDSKVIYHFLIVSNETVEIDLFINVLEALANISTTDRFHSNCKYKNLGYLVSWAMFCGVDSITIRSLKWKKAVEMKPSTVTE